MKIKATIITSIALVAAFSITSCGGSEEGNNKSARLSPGGSSEAIDPMEDTGIGPVKELVLPAEIDQGLVAKGKTIYSEKCTACHKPTKKFTGPAPIGIFERRNPAWVMNMILNPEEMVLKNAQARKLLIAYNGSPMANQNLTEPEARAVVEYFRTL